MGFVGADHVQVTIKLQWRFLSRPFQTADEVGARGCAFIDLWLKAFLLKKLGQIVRRRSFVSGGVDGLNLDQPAQDALSFIEYVFPLQLSQHA